MAARWGNRLRPGDLVTEAVKNKHGQAAAWVFRVKDLYFNADAGRSGEITFYLRATGGSEAQAADLLEAERRVTRILLQAFVGLVSELLEIWRQRPVARPERW